MSVCPARDIVQFIHLAAEPDLPVVEPDECLDRSAAISTPNAGNLVKKRLLRMQQQR